ncbi:MAG: putative heme-binding domain-containing protein, partial [Planctomycetota bacterium]
LERARPETLIAGLSHEVLAWRNHAQRILIEQGQLDVVPALLDVVDLGQVDSAGLATAGMHALWSMNALGAVDSSNERVLETLRGALSHPARGLRRAALQVLPRDDFGLALLLQGGLLLDTDPKVRLQALLTLSEMPASSTAAAQLLQLASSIQRDQDPELVDAITIAAANCDAEFLQALFAQEHSDQGVSTSATSEEPSNLAPNPSFEAALPGTELPVAWETRSYSGLAAHSRVEGGRTSSHSLSVSSEDGADASWSARIAVNPGSRYRFSAWIRTEGIEAGSGRGAQINVHELQGANTVRTEAITGTRDWTKVALTFEPGRLEAVTLNCLFGGWGRSQGTAWFDDVTLERVDVPVLPGALGLILGDVTRHYAGRAPAESVSATIASLEGTSEVLGTTVLNSLERGWRGKPAPNLNDTDRRRLRSSALNLQGEAREALALLLVSWDQAPLMGAALESVTAELLLCASDPEADPERRVAAARRMILLNDSDGNVRSLLDSIDLDTEPGLAGDLISLLSSSTEETTGVLLLEAITRLGPSAQAVAVETLCRRDIWTHVLLTAIQERELSANALSPSMWLTLENHPTPELAAFARDAHRSRPSSERMALVEEMLSRPALAGDVDRGALLYAENCAKCHSEGSTGRRLGPALDGIGKNPRGEVLASILDPNRAVEANYLMWIARTFDGQLTTGQLLSESRTAVEILESSGEVRILQREDIESIEPSTLSLMPEGFESLGDQALADLLEFLTGTH